MASLVHLTLNQGISTKDATAIYEQCWAADNGHGNGNGNRNGDAKCPSTPPRDRPTTEARAAYGAAEAVGGSTRASGGGGGGGDKVGAGAWGGGTGAGEGGGGVGDEGMDYDQFRAAFIAPDVVGGHNAFGEEERKLTPAEAYAATYTGASGGGGSGRYVDCGDGSRMAAAAAGRPRRVVGAF